MNRNLIILLIVCLFLLAAVQSFLIYHNKTYSKAEIAKLFESVSAKYGIDIVYEIDENFLSSLVNPGIPAGPSRNAKVKPIRHRILSRYPGILLKAFNRYPIKVIQNYLSAVHFAKEIEDNGFQCAGSYDPFKRVVYLVDDGENSEKQSMHTFHHEFSSLLLKRHTLLLNPWFDQNPEGFEYLYKLKRSEMLETYNSSSLIGTEIDNEKGFLNTYAQTNFENDFNEYSAMIFTYPEKFKKIMSQYPRVRGKFQVWLEFYQKIDPIFTEEYLLGNS